MHLKILSEVDDDNIPVANQFWDYTYQLGNHLRNTIQDPANNLGTIGLIGAGITSLAALIYHLKKKSRLQSSNIYSLDRKKLEELSALIFYIGETEYTKINPNRNNDVRYWYQVKHEVNDGTGDISMSLFILPDSNSNTNKIDITTKLMTNKGYWNYITDLFTSIQSEIEKRREWEYFNLCSFTTPDGEYIDFFVEIT